MVKRSDEQEFARLNAEKLMLCEDAVPKIKAMLEQSTWIKPKNRSWITIVCTSS